MITYRKILFSSIVVFLICSCTPPTKLTYISFGEEKIPITSSKIILPLQAQKFTYKSDSHLLYELDSLIVLQQDGVQINNALEADTLEIVNNLKSGIWWGLTWSLASYVMVKAQRTYENRGGKTVKKASDFTQTL